MLQIKVFNWYECGTRENAVGFPPCLQRLRVRGPNQTQPNSVHLRTDSSNSEEQQGTQQVKRESVAQNTPELYVKI